MPIVTQIVGYILIIFFINLNKKNKMIMKKMLYYIFSTFFLLTILNSCGVEDAVEAIVTDVGDALFLSSLEGDYTGDSDLDLSVLLTPAVPVTSELETDGAAVEFKNETTNNLVITLEDAQLSIAGQTAVDFDGVFTFTASSFTQANTSDPVGFTVAETGSADITVGPGPAITGLDLTGIAPVTGSTPTDNGVSLTATVNLTKVAANALITAFGATGITVPDDGVDVTVTLAVTRITDRQPTVAPTLAEQLAGNHTGDSDLDLNVALTTPVAVTSDVVVDGAAVVFNDDATSVEVTVTDAQLSVASGADVAVSGEFTFAVSALTEPANDGDPIGFTIATTGSVDLTVAPATTATTLSLTGVTATVATSDGITLTATANLTAAQATALVQAFNSTAPAVAAATDVTFTLTVTNIEEDATP